MQHVHHGRSVQHHMLTSSQRPRPPPRSQTAVTSSARPEWKAPVVDPMTNKPRLVEGLYTLEHTPLSRLTDRGRSWMAQHSTTAVRYSSTHVYVRTNMFKNLKRASKHLSPTAT